MSPPRYRTPGRGARQGAAAGLALSVLVCGGGLAQSIPSFRHDIMPILSKAGCNTGACHGSASGKGKLKLSLRGESPEEDFATLTAEPRGRRLDLKNPDASALLRKPAELTDHEGGRRIDPDGEAFRLIRTWIAGGAVMDPTETPVLTRLAVSPPGGLFVEPIREVALTTTAHFSDGTSRDITRWAVYEPSNLLVTVSPDGVVRAEKSGDTTVIVRFQHLQAPVSLAFMPDRPPLADSLPAPRNLIDEAVFARLRERRLPASPEDDNSTFARRAWLDLTGRLPTADQARAFVADSAPDKRDRLIDSLLASPEFADHWALKWADLLRVEERLLDVTGVTAFHRWIRQNVADDRPLDQFTRAIVTGLGSTYQHPPANFYRAIREPTLRAEAVAQVFLGTRLGCAKCHNHPFERWTQDDYYRFAAVFDRLDYTILRNDRRDENDKMEFVGEQVVVLGGKSELKHPKSGAIPAPAFLGEGGHAVPDDQALARLGDWMTRPDHPLFDRVQVNRIWSHLMGTGIVEPVDDFRLTNPPSNPALLEALTRFFVENGRRVRPLIRLICQSRTWHLSSTPRPENADDTVHYSHPVVRRLPAEPLLDAIHQVLNVEPRFGSYPDTSAAAAIPGVRLGGRRSNSTDADLFLKDFGKPPRTTVCGCERSNESSLSQVFTLTSGPGLARLLSHPENRLSALAEAHRDPAASLDELFWATLTRPPAPEESAALLPLLADPATRRAALEDITWSLINAKEFLLRH
ncbi:MAG: DUF1549 and DUF1553 domain-containing protein [Verrucomicrobiales bacterium]